VSGVILKGTFVLKMENVKMPRWAFNFEEWKPTSTEWENLLKLVQREERERILKY
jgi:hypothetical protein